MGWAAKQQKARQKRLDMECVAVYGHDDDQFQELISIFYAKGFPTLRENGWDYITTITPLTGPIILGLSQVSLSQDNRTTFGFAWLLGSEQKNFFKRTIKPNLKALRKKVATRARRDYKQAQVIITSPGQ